jgi:signal transduction histidine kinase
MHRVRLLLLIGGGIAVAASMAAGWWLAGRAIRPIRRAYDAQAAFAADASHELRSPLAFVRAGVEVLGDSRPELGHDVLGEIDYLTELTERLLTLARSDGRRLQLSPRPFDLVELCRAAARRAAVGRGLRVEVSSVNGVRAFADPVATAAVMDVLLENAAVHGGGRAVVKCASLEGGATVAVMDQGPGMTPEEMRSAFDRFFRADPARSSDARGAGLGLSIARDLAQAQGGSIRLDPTAGGGVTARVILPLPGSRV